MVRMRMMCSMKTAPSHTPHAFSLIELLVVIAIERLGTRR